MNLSWFDVLVLCIFTYGSIIGFRRGLIVELGSLISLFTGLVGVFKYSSNLSYLINSIFNWPSFASYIISSIIIFFSISYTISMFAKLITKAIKISVLSLFNRISGLIFGILKYLLILSFIIFIINEVFFMEFYSNNDNQIQSSVTYDPLLRLAELIIEIIDVEELNSNNNWEKL
ncbi:MAG: hypothetical protein CL824_06315 [Crocinitomicaceae bacterium]|nr:hypothetical protein [Crocinitomicaceae bacterium]|tara:strand:+ start:1595 stop:2119 length:525 start_codon:yes stop_codon:yes gene_type:complete